jgi:hypothetical protein
MLAYGPADSALHFLSTTTIVNSNVVTMLIVPWNLKFPVPSFKGQPLKADIISPVSVSSNNTDL